MKEDLRDIFAAGLEAADPGRAVLRALRCEGEAIFSFEAERVFVLAAGKAAGAMATAAGELLRDRVSGGLVITKEGHRPGPEQFKTLFASHPEPDERGVEVARCVEELVDSLEAGDLLLALISGGASALLADPVPPISLSDLKQLTGALLKSGASIGDINTVRKHISTLKGGGLVRRAAPARTLALLLSDVVGDDPSAIASGLTAPDPTTLEDARDVLKRYAIDPPRSISERLENGPETPKPGDSIFERVTHIICGGGRLSSEAAAAKARQLGYEPMLLSTTITGDARGAASVYAAIIREVLETGNPIPPPCALVSGGEATVTVRGDGLGGPNQEFALALAVELAGVENWAALSADTDGNDGPTDAAGGIVTGSTARSIRENGVDPTEALRKNDAYTALKAGDALLVTGPTGTNVNDLRIALVGRKRRRPEA